MYIYIYIFGAYTMSLYASFQGAYVRVVEDFWGGCAEFRVQGLRFRVDRGGIYGVLWAS